MFQQQPAPPQQQRSYQTTSGSESDHSQKRRPTQQQQQQQQPWTDDDEWSSQQHSQQRPAEAEDQWQAELEAELEASQRAQSEAEQWRLYNAQVQASRREQQMQDEADQQAEEDEAALHRHAAGQRLAVVVTDADQEHAEQQAEADDRYQQQRQQPQQHQVEVEEAEEEEDDPRAAELMRQQMFAHFNRSHSVPVLPQPMSAPAVAAAPAMAQRRQSPGLQHSLQARSPSATSAREQPRATEDGDDHSQWNRTQPLRHPMEVVYAEDEEDERPVLQYTPSFQQQQQQRQQQHQQRQEQLQREQQQQREYEQQRQEEEEWQWQQQQQEQLPPRDQRQRASDLQALPQAQRFAANQLHRQQVLLEQQAIRERDQQRAEQSVVRPPSAGHRSSSFVAFAAASSRGGSPLRRADQPLPGQGRLNEISHRLQEIAEQKTANARAMASFSAANAAASSAATAASSTAAAAASSSAARSSNASMQQHSLSSIEPLDDSRSNLLDALRKIQRMRGARGHSAILSHSAQASGLKSPIRDGRPGILAHSLSPSFAASHVGAGLKPLRMHGLLRNQALASSVELGRSKLIDPSEVPSFLGQNNSNNPQQQSFAQSLYGGGPMQSPSQMSRAMHDLSLSAILASPAARTAFEPLSSPSAAGDDAPPLVADAFMQSERTKRQLEALKLQQVVLQQSHLALDASVRNLGDGQHIDRSMLRPATSSFVAPSSLPSQAVPVSKHAAMHADMPVFAVHSHRSPALQPRAPKPVDDAEEPSLFLFSQDEASSDRHRSAHEDRMAEQEIAMQQRQLQRSVLIAQQDAVLQQQQQLLMHNATQLAHSIATSMPTPVAVAAPSPPAPSPPAPTRPAPSSVPRSRYHPAHVAHPYPYVAAADPGSLADTVSAHDLQRQLDSTAQVWDEVDDLLTSHANTVIAPHDSPSATLLRTRLASPATTIKADASSNHSTVPAASNDSSTTVQTAQGHSITVNVHPIIHLTQPGASPVAALHHSVVAAAREANHTPQHRSPFRDAASLAAQTALSHYPVSHPPSHPSSHLSSARLAPASPLDGLASAMELERQKGIFINKMGRVHPTPAQSRPTAAGFAASAARAFRHDQQDPLLDRQALVSSGPTPESLLLEAELADFQAREFQADPSDDRYLAFMVAQKKRQLDQLTEVEQSEALGRQKERMEFERKLAEIEQAAREAEATMRKEEVVRQQAIAEVQSASRSRLAALSPEQQLRAHNRTIYEDRHEPDPLERSKPRDHSAPEASPQRSVNGTRARELSPDRSLLASRRGLPLPSEDELLSAEEDAARQRTAAARAHIAHMDAMEDAQRASMQVQRADDDAEFEEDLRTERARAQAKWEAKQKEIDTQTRAIIAEQVRAETAARHAILTRQREKADAEFAARQIAAEQEAMEDKARMDALRLRDEHLQNQRRERVEWEERQRQQAERDLRKREENLQKMRNERMDKEIQMRREIEQQVLVQANSHRVRVGSPISVSLAAHPRALTPQPPADVHSHRSDGVADHPPSPPSPPLARRRATSSPHENGPDDSPPLPALPAVNPAPISVSVSAVPASPSSAQRQAKLAQQAQLIEQTKAQLALIQARTLEISSRPSSTVNSPVHGATQPYQHHRDAVPESTPPRDPPLASHSTFFPVSMGLPLPPPPLSAATSAREEASLPSLPPSADNTARELVAPPPAASGQAAGPTPIPAPYPFLPGGGKPGASVPPSASNHVSLQAALDDAAEQRAIEAALASPDPPARVRSSLLSPSTVQQHHDDAGGAYDGSASLEDSVDDFGFAKHHRTKAAESSQDGASFASVSRSAAPSTRVGSGRPPASSAALDASYGGSSDDFGWLNADADLIGGVSATPAPASDWRKQRAERWGNAAAATANATPASVKQPAQNSTPAPITRVGRPGMLPNAAARVSVPSSASATTAGARSIGRESRVPPPASRASASPEADVAAMMREIESEAETEVAAATAARALRASVPTVDPPPIDAGESVDFDALIREAEDATTWLP